MKGVCVYDLKPPKLNTERDRYEVRLLLHKSGCLSYIGKIVKYILYI